MLFLCVAVVVLSIASCYPVYYDPYNYSYGSYPSNNYAYAGYSNPYASAYNGYNYAYGAPVYPTPLVNGGVHSIYPGYGGWINPLGTGSGWAAGGGLVGNIASFIAG